MEDVWTEQIRPTAPFDFREMLRRPLSRPSKASLIDLASASYTTVVRTSTGPVPVTVEDEGIVDEPMLKLLAPGGMSRQVYDEISRCVRHMFSTDVPLTQFYEHVGHDSTFAALTDKYRGLRPIHDGDLFESMIKVLVGQQVNVKFAATLVERLIEQGGEAVEWNGTRIPVFPSVQAVAGWNYEKLRACSYSARKAEYVIDFARAIVNGQVVLDKLWSMSDDEIYSYLLPIRGIGRWTVECFLLFGMARQDVMPAADIGVQNAMLRLYGHSDRPKEQDIRQRSESFVPWRSYATYYLWQSLIPPTGAENP